MPTRSVAAVIVENNTWDHLEVFLQHDGRRDRIMDIGPLSTRQLLSEDMFRARRGGMSLFVAKPTLGDPIVSEPFVVPDRGIPVWTINSSRGTSLVTVR